jgi:hypothetical protein
MNYQNNMYYKMMRNDFIHHGFTYKLGLNVDTIKFNPTGSCLPGGLYFTDIDNLGTFFEFGNLIAIIKIPNDALVYKEPCGTKWKADRLIIDKIDTIDSYWHIYRFCIQAVKQNGQALKYVKDQSDEVCLAAVKQTGIALKYVKDQTPEICMEAVKQCCHALQYVKNQTPEICMEAVMQYGITLKYVKDQYTELCMEAVKHYGMAFKYVKDQTPEICMEAVMQ